MGLGSGGKLAVGGEIEKKKRVGPLIHHEDHTPESGPQAQPLPLGRIGGVESSKLQPHRPNLGTVILKA